jgi:hypothetical protein
MNPTVTLRRIGAPLTTDPRGRTGLVGAILPESHEGHPVAILPGGIEVCTVHQDAKACVCGAWIVADEGFEFEAIRAHQRSAVHKAYHKRTHERLCIFCRRSV